MLSPPSVYSSVRSRSVLHHLRAARHRGHPRRHPGGGTTAWAGEGRTLHRPENAQAPWPMERQVRLAAGSLIVLGLAAGTRWRPARWLSAAIGTGLVFSAATNTCGMAAALAKLPHNQPRTTDLDAALRALQD